MLWSFELDRRWWNLCMQSPSFPNKILFNLFMLMQQISVVKIALFLLKICYRFLSSGPGKLRKSPWKVMEKSLDLFWLMGYEPCNLWKCHLTSYWIQYVSWTQIVYGSIGEISQLAKFLSAQFCWTLQYLFPLWANRFSYAKDCGLQFCRCAL